MPLTCTHAAHAHPIRIMRMSSRRGDAHVRTGSRRPVCVRTLRSAHQPTPNQPQPTPMTAPDDGVVPCTHPDRQETIR